MSSTYAAELIAEAKETCVVFDFPEVTTRFTCGRGGPDLVLPAGWTEFKGAIPIRDSGSKLSVRNGKISVGDSGFTVPDVDSTVTAWLKLNDATLSETKVLRRNGFEGVPESQFQTSRWVLGDYEVEGRAGAGYLFTIRAIARSLARGVFDDFEREDFRLAEGGGNLSAGASSIVLEETPPSTWRQPGQAALWDEDNKNLELVDYDTIVGKTLTTVTRRVFAVGKAAHVFTEEATRVFHVWSRRGHPFDIMLELATSSAAAGASSPTDFLANPQLDDWSGGSPDDWSATTPGGTIDEIVGQSGAGSAARIERTQGGEISLAKITSTDAALHLDPDKWYVLSFCYRLNEVRGDTNTLQLSIKNTTQAESLQADKTWDAFNYQRPLTSARADVWLPYYEIFHVDAGFGAGNSWRINWGFGGIAANQPIADVDGILGVPLLLGPFDEEPTGPFDIGVDGLGIEIEFFDLLTLATIRASDFPPPTFDGGDLLTAGTAVLFVEQEPIRDLKVWIEDHLFRPYAIFPSVDGEERWSAQLYFQVGTDPIIVDDAWDKGRFAASSWRRNYDNRINVLDLQSDYNLGESEYALNKEEIQATSIARYGRSKPSAVRGRGHRTGKLGFPDYSGEDPNDLELQGRRILLELANASTEIRVRTLYRFRDLSIADVIQISIPGVPDLQAGTLGMVQRLFAIVRRRVDDRTGTVELTIRERRPVTRPALVAPASQRGLAYSAATEAQRLFCALTPGSAMNFDNGDEGYTVP